MNKLKLLLFTIISLTFCSVKAEPADSLARDVAIELNGADWTGLAAALSAQRETPVSIVHIGDSHLQAETPTMELRRKFQTRFGNAGRGLVSPLKMSGTYQPIDYTISSTGKWTASKFLRYPWTPKMWFSGTALKPVRLDTDITVAVADREAAFNDLQIFHRGAMSILSVRGADGGKLDYTAQNLPGRWTSITLAEPVDEVTISFMADVDFVFHAVELANGQPGVIYNTIGNGGSDMGMYNLIPEFGRGISNLFPDLIILALGTNDSYNNYTDAKFLRNLDRIVGELRSANPDAQILLVSPMEIQYAKTIRTKKRVKGRKGRYRTVTTKSKNRTVVESIASIRDIMREYARQNNIAFYDWYEAAGGEGASARWVDAGLMRADHIHLTADGYQLHARKLFDSILDALNLSDADSSNELNNLSDN